MKKATNATQTNHVARSKNKPAHGRTHKRFQRISAHMRIPLACLVALALIVPALGYATPPDVLDLPIPSDTPATTEGDQTSSNDETNSPTTAAENQNNKTDTSSENTEDSSSNNSSTTTSTTEQVYADSYEQSIADGIPLREGLDPITTQAVDHPATAAELEPWIVKDTVNPANTTINLFDYDTGRRSGDRVDGVVIGSAPGNSTHGSDTIGTTGDKSAEFNCKVWLGNDGNNINYGHLLTFGDGMRWLGAWNQGLVKQYGNFALEHPGMQNIVQKKTMNGYPILNNEPETPDPQPITVGYNGYPNIYKTATRDNNTLIYNLCGGKNISEDTQKASIAANGGVGSVGNLTDDELSLQYLFDPDVTNQGKKSYKNVDGLFQLDDEGYLQHAKEFRRIR